MNILIIGSDSYIAKQFIKSNANIKIKGISRSVASFKNELVVSDFFMIKENDFIDADVVINFAAIVHRPDIKEFSIYDKINNQLAVLNARKSKLAGAKLFVQMSTIGIYGNIHDINIYSQSKPQNPYALSKYIADQNILSMQGDSFKVAIIRPPMVYGGGEAPGNMMKLIKLVDRCLFLPFKGINNNRDYINVHNLVQYLTIIAEKKLNGIYLISDQEPVSLEYLINIILKYMKGKIFLLKAPELLLKLLKLIRPNEFDRLFGNLKVQTNFPFEYMINRFSVEQGISEMVEWYNNKHRHII